MDTKCDILLLIKNTLYGFATPEKARVAKRFFKTDKGAYGEGDVFIGVTVPEIRSTVRQLYKEVTLKDIQSLLHSKVHEERSLALMLLTKKYQKTKNVKLVEFYINYENLLYINNWDLVDLSCYKILGDYLLLDSNKTKILYDFAKSPELWVKRIAIVSTLAFIRQNQFDHTIAISKLLLADKHDLIHKAVGWMLREVGKRNGEVLMDFLREHHTTMPRVMFRYANEKLCAKF